MNASSSGADSNAALAASGCAATDCGVCATPAASAVVGATASGCVVASGCPAAAAAVASNALTTLAHAVVEEARHVAEAMTEEARHVAEAVTEEARCVADSTNLTKICSTLQGGRTLGSQMEAQAAAHEEQLAILEMMMPLIEAHKESIFPKATLVRNDPCHCFSTRLDVL